MRKTKTKKWPEMHYRNNNNKNKEEENKNKRRKREALLPPGLLRAPRGVVVTRKKCALALAS